MVEALIERLADKTLNGECVVRHTNRVGAIEIICPDRVEIIGCPVFIGDVLEKLYSLNPCVYMHEELIDIWKHLDMRKSLQTIIEESGWEESPLSKCPCGGDVSCKRCQGVGIIKPKYRLKEPARALIEFLITIFK